MPLKLPQKLDVKNAFMRFLDKGKTNILSLSFWLGLTMGFPLEHFLWEKVWPFRAITAWIGLDAH